MTLQEKAASLSQEEIVELLASQEELKQQLEWFKRQLFGSTSERRVVPAADSRQMGLGEQLATTTVETAPQITVPSHARRGRKQPWEGAPDDSGLRYDPSVPVIEIEVPNADAETHPPDSYDVVDHKVTCRLAQKRGSYVILRYVRKVIKLKSEEKFSYPPLPTAVLEKSYADVSFLAGLLIDKFRYHLPLYRQHQRLEASGIKLSRATLTNLVHRTAALLEPIYEAQLESIQQSSVLAMDETPIKAGLKRQKQGKGKMKSAYFWPLYGDRDEIAFFFSPSRGQDAARRALRTFSGILVTDGYEVYERFAQATDGVQRAQCWAHARRKFVQSESVEPELSNKALDFVSALYEHETTLRERGLADGAKLEFRATHSKPIVDAFFAWLNDAFHERILLPTNPFTKAASYALEREDSLRVFLENPDVPIDTNHLEREVRSVAVGRKNWLFCWTEVGAKYAGVVQSLLTTCRLQSIDPYVYFVDVLQRIAIHPAHQVEQLTPRLWKEHFAAEPFPSDLELGIARPVALLPPPQKTAHELERQHMSQDDNS